MSGTRDAACGELPLAGRRATLRVGELRLVGAVAVDGRFAVSPFTIIDAYDLPHRPPAPAAIELERADGSRLQLEAILDPATLAPARDAYLTALGVEPRIEALRKVPRLAATNLTVTRTHADDGGAAVRIGVVLANDGPGDAWGVRGTLSADNADLDGRYLYIGHVAAKATITASVVVPLSNATVRFDQIGLAMLLRDAHATVPRAPIEFRGVVMNDGD